MNRVNQVWSTDITYIRMAQGFVYLVAVMDWFSRFVLSWALSVTMEVSFCIEALEKALALGAAGDLQQRPRVAVHQREVHRRAERAGHRRQHGWARALPGQHFHRTTVAFAEIRRGVLAGLPTGAGGARRHRPLVPVLQLRTAAPEPAVPNAGGSLP